MTARRRIEWDVNGMPREVHDVSGMLAPYSCGACGHVHDTAKVEVVARYTDCSVWRCPSCKATQDDRQAWGFHSPGQARRIDRRTGREESR